MVHIYYDLALIFDHLIKAKISQIKEHYFGHKRSLEDSWSLELKQGRKKRNKNKEASSRARKVILGSKDLFLQGFSGFQVGKYNYDLNFVL